MADLSVSMAGVTFKNPIIPASGTFGFGREYTDYYPVSVLGGMSLKGTTLHQRAGNPPPRIAETPMGMLNSVGLQNPGIDYFLSHELPKVADEDTVIIANIAGAAIEDYVETVQKLEGSAVDMIELNISCPNVKLGGAALGTSCAAAGEATRAVRKATTKPLMVKLSPNVTDIAEIARAVEAEGADAVSLINTPLGMRIDIRTRRPILHNNVGGMSGPAVFPIAVRMVWQVANAVKIPVSGIGGVASYQDAIEMMMAGATTVQVGAAMFQNPMAPVEIIEGMNRWLDEQHIAAARGLIGSVQPW